MKIYSVVKLKNSLPEHGLVQGQKGTILEIYNDRDCEIEFCDSYGITLYLGSFPFDMLEPAEE